MFLGLGGLLLDMSLGLGTSMFFCTFLDHISIALAVRGMQRLHSHRRPIAENVVNIWVPQD